MNVNAQCPYCRRDSDLRLTDEDQIDGDWVNEYRCTRCGLVFITKDRAHPSARRVHPRP